MSPFYIGWTDDVLYTVNKLRYKTALSMHKFPELVGTGVISYILDNQHELILFNDPAVVRITMRHGIGHITETITPPLQAA